MRLAVNVLSGALRVLTGAASAQAQLGYDRPGSDYLSVTVQSGDPAACAARCYLKSKIPRPRRKPCCISGVVR